MARRTFSYRLFRLGAIPPEVRAVLQREGLVVWDEGIPGTAVTRKLRAPGRFFWRRAAGFSGFLAVSRNRVMACSYRRRQINIGIDDPKIADLHCRMPKPGQIELSFESSRFRPDWSGVICFRFTTKKARDFERALLAAGCSWGLAS